MFVLICENKEKKEIVSLKCDLLMAEIYRKEYEDVIPEYYLNKVHWARSLDYNWVLNIREQCINKKIDFEFRQCGTYFIKDGKQYTLQVKDLMKQAKSANINWKKETN